MSLLRKYANPSNRWDDEFVSASDKRLRWLKCEAYGNSKFATTASNVRHAYTTNRKLQKKLGGELQCMANHHGRKCDELEKNQDGLLSGIKRNEDVKNNWQYIPSAYSKFPTSSCTRSFSRHGDSMPIEKPYASAKRYMVFQHSGLKACSPLQKQCKDGANRQTNLIRFDTTKNRRTEEVMLTNKGPKDKNIHCPYHYL